MIKYRIVSELGRGGMAVVYRALHTDLDREVALKMLHPASVADLEALKRFRREVKLAGSLCHPNIVRVFDHGEADGRCYYTMEIIEGETVSQLVADQGPLPLETVASYVGQAADALDHVHRLGLFHRDIKLSNLMVDASGHLTVMDFGLARGTSATLLTSDGEVPGTPRYVAPEAIRQEDLTSAQDVYALALCTHEMLTGKPWVRTGSFPELLTAILTGPAPSLETAIPGTPCWLLNLQAAALSKSPAERPSARGYGETFQANLPVPGGPPRVERSAPGLADARKPRPRQTAPGTDTRSRRARLLAGLLGMLAVTAFGLLAQRGRGPSTTRQSSPAPDRLPGPDRRIAGSASSPALAPAPPPSPAPSTALAIRTYCSGLERLAQDTDAMAKGFNRWATGTLSRLGSGKAGARFAAQWATWGWADKNREYLRQTRDRDPNYRSLQSRAGSFLTRCDDLVRLAAAAPLPPGLEYRFGLAMANLVECAVVLDVRTARQLRTECAAVTARLAGTMTSGLFLAALARVQDDHAARLESAIQAVEAGRRRLDLADRSAGNVESFRTWVELHYLLLRCYEDLGTRGPEGLARYRAFASALPGEICSHPAIAGRLQRVTRLAEKLPVR